MKHFIVANVTKYNDVIAFEGNETELRAKAKVLQKGRDYVMEDADVVHFKVS
jgi:ribosome-binding ATPase YchF (GTP1/OBG family)